MWITLNACFTNHRKYNINKISRVHIIHEHSSNSNAQAGNVLQSPLNLEIFQYIHLG
jgi:hypothetical protein